MSGGNGNTSHYASIGHLKDEGYSINSSFERFSGRLNLSHRAKPWLKGSFNIGYTFAKIKNIGQGQDSSNIFLFVNNTPPIYPLFLRDEDGNFVPDPYYGGNQFDYGEGGRGFSPLANAIADAIYGAQRSERHEMNANFLLQANITKDLSFETRLGGQYYNGSGLSYANPYYGPSANEKGRLSRSDIERFTYNFQKILRYESTFDTEHKINALAAHESHYLKDRSFSASKYTMVVPDLLEFNNFINNNSIGSYVSDFSLESYFTQVDYSYLNKYFFTGSWRTDGSSRFLINKWDQFYSLGAGWILSRENFLKDNKILKFLKLKTSYGTTGDQAGVGFYGGFDVWNASNFAGIPVATFSRVGYPNLTWEKAKMFQTGAELTLFNNRALEITLDYYRKLTTQLIFDNRIPPSTGNAIIKVNDGLLLNQGLEFNIIAHLIQKKDFFLDFSMNGETIRNRILRMPIDFATGREKIIDGSYVRGKSLFDFYIREYRGVNPDNGEALFTRYYHDKNDNGKLDDNEGILSLYEYMANNPNAKILETTTGDLSQATLKFINKSSIPDLRGAFNINTGYKGFSLSVQMLYSIGGYRIDNAYADLMSSGRIGNNNYHVDIRDRWQKPGDKTDIPRISSGFGQDDLFNNRSTRFLTKGDYLMLNNIRLSYSLPKKYCQYLNLNSLVLSVSGDNLWVASHRRGFNPYFINGTYSYNPLSTLSFGLKTSF
ncbi:TonB-dependent receptor [Riemerella anatipestifer]|uniref:TonB-dependent receptor n=1 Tax=Riemerella anatipestifer TaxID=34085 RepID=UPI001E2C084E|nr:TonB-dependent receptor [Riemerella anatipestifer]MCD5967950.1 TonB-dependent receptor [Riemerella anatipestifer]MCO7316988.1 TonB-dependent receptor [Riemerella anatipestifer]MCO7324656.1 TonB-dependent receptor [Riemerella anatipestifer]MCO7355283.1 TonB-dependent receptor [Riemerella anatipestifer]UFZ23899.1 TonB-dependent receptor [Riemerella anatipestifer]